MKTNASKQAATTKGGKKNKNTQSAAPEAPVVAEAAVAVIEPPPAPAPAASAVRVSSKLTGEHIQGVVLGGGVIDVIVKRRDLSAKPESKVALMKRLLCTEGQTKDTILLAATPLHKGSASSLVNTLNTVRADLRRAVGAKVVAKGWKTDAKAFLPPTAAVARLRTHEIGVGLLSAGIVPVELQAKKVAAPKATVITTEEVPGETPAQTPAETTEAPEAPVETPAVPEAPQTETPAE